MGSANEVSISYNIFRFTDFFQPGVLLSTYPSEPIQAILKVIYLAYIFIKLFQVGNIFVTSRAEELDIQLMDSFLI